MNALFEQHLNKLLASNEADERQHFLETGCWGDTKEEFIEQLHSHSYYSWLVIFCRGDAVKINEHIDALWYKYADGNDVLYDGKKSYDDRGYLCYWDDEEGDWIASEEYATARFMNVLRNMNSYEGFHLGADDDTDDETTHEDFDTDTVICKSCNLPFYDLLDDGPFCNCENI